MQNRSQVPVVTLKMQVKQVFYKIFFFLVTTSSFSFTKAKTVDPITSRNVIGEFRGSTHPEQIVVISGILIVEIFCTRLSDQRIFLQSGHIDSWDVGQGAMDDGAGFFRFVSSVFFVFCL
jgi:Zn-dependent M28 family amino/carboxypeptidase